MTFWGVVPPLTALLSASGMVMKNVPSTDVVVNRQAAIRNNHRGMSKNALHTKIEYDINSTHMVKYENGSTAIWYIPTNLILVDPAEKLNWQNWKVQNVPSYNTV